jgi:hypothetical protein
MRNFIGRNGFKWFVGVVEDRNDPIQLGRVRVRAFGWHTDDKGSIPTEDLPWAIVMNGIDSASVSGVGKSPTGMVEGSWVFGFFVDGDRAQEPAIMGTMPGMPSEKSNSAFGFNDPTEKFPRYTNESDVNKLARGENTRVYAPDQLIDEPEAPYNAKYPYNHVYESESGHTKEYDDTEGAERIKEQHKSGTFYEVHPNGDKVEHIIKDNYQVIAGNDNIHVNGNVNVFVDGNVNLKVTGDYRADIGGTCDIISGGNMKLIAPRIDWNPTATSPNLGAIPTETDYGSVDISANAQEFVAERNPSSAVSTSQCLDLDYDNETAWITKIIQEIWMKMNWTRGTRLFTNWSKYYKKYPQLGTVDFYANFDTADASRVRIEENRPDGTRVHTLIAYTKGDANFLEEIRSSVEVMAREIRAKGDGEELYNLMNNIIDTKIPVFPIKKLLHTTVKSPTMPKGQMEPKSTFQVLGGGWYEFKDFMLFLKLPGVSTLETFIHELGGHDHHVGQWGKGNTTLLTDKEVDSLSSTLTTVYRNSFRNPSMLADKFLMLSAYQKFQMEDEFLARVLGHLAVNRCTTFEVDMYPTLCRLGVKLSEKTVKAIDAEMVSHGLSRKVPNNYKAPADVTYA